MPTGKRSLLASVLAAASLVLAAAPAAAAPTAEPGATLLIPYFEVDLGQPDGLTTLFSITNASPVANTKLLAHAIVWSDWGIPVYSWDFYLAPGDLVSYNLRDLLTYGNLPATSPPADFGASCARPLTATVGSPEAQAALQRQLTGRADKVSGLCASEPRQNAAVATGSITIDVVRDCAHGGVDDPFDSGYFDGAQALAGSTNALVGDFFLVDPAADLAEGYSAYPLHQAAGNYSFWEGAERPDLRREPLSANWRLRFLEGGPFAARTSFFVFHRRLVPPAPAACETIPLGTGPHGTWTFEVYSPSGELLHPGLTVPDQGRRTAARVELDLPDGALSGTVNFHAVYLVGLGVPVPTDGQSMLFGGIEARGRFGVGIFGTPLD